MGAGASIGALPLAARPGYLAERPSALCLGYLAARPSARASHLYQGCLKPVPMDGFGPICTRVAWVRHRGEG